MDVEGALVPATQFGHAGIMDGNKVCMIMNEYFYLYHTLGTLHKGSFNGGGRGRRDIRVIQKR